MGLFDGLFRKQSAVGNAIARYHVGQPVFSPRDYGSLSKEGYLINVIGFRCINALATSIADVTWKVVDENEQEVEKHPLIDLLYKPNPTQSGKTFFKQAVSYWLCSGNLYLEKVALSRTPAPRELYAHRPDRMKVVPGEYGIPLRYEYEVDGITKNFEMDQLNGKGPIRHVKMFHPSNDWYGMSPLEAAAYAIDQHNAASRHNTSFLQNGLRTSGMLIWKSKPLKEEVDRVQQLLVDRFTGPNNTGKPLQIGGDATWQEMSTTPRDADFIKGKEIVGREICYAFGVPPVLVIPGEGTFSNRADGRLEMWEDTIIPLLNLLAEELTAWLLPDYGNQKLVLVPDLNNVSALAPRREAAFARGISGYNAGLLKKNEARVQMGLDVVPEGEEFKPAPMAGSGLLGGAAQEKTFHVKELTPDNAWLVVTELSQPEVLAHTHGLLEAMLATMVAEFGAEVIEEIGAMSAFETTLRVNDFIYTHSAELITGVDAYTKQSIRDELVEAFHLGESRDKIIARIDEVFEFAETTRAARIAETEATTAAGFSAVEAMTQSGVEMKEWVATFYHTRDTHAKLDGQKVATTGRFQSSSGDTALYPGGFSTAAENINCRCAAIAHIPEKAGRRTKSREEIYDKREASRAAMARRYEPIISDLFRFQRQIVIKRLRDVGGEG